MKKSSVIVLCTTGVCALVAAAIAVNRTPQRVAVADVSFGDFSKTIEITGQVTAGGRYTVTAESGGRVSSVTVREGQKVEIGDPLYTLDQSQIMAQIEQAKKELEQAKSAQRLAQAQSQKQVQDDVTPVMNMEDESLEASVNKSNEVIARAQGEGIDYQTFNEAIENVRDAMAEQTVASTQGKEENDAQAAAAIAAANTRVKTVSSRIQELEESLGALACISQAEGTVVGLNIVAGNVLEEGKTVLEIADTDKLTVVAQVESDTLKQVKVGQRAQIWQNEQVWKGTVTRVSPQVTAKDGQTYGEVEVQPDPGFTELIGENLDVSIVTEQATDVCMIPADCIASDEDGLYVMAVEGNRLAKRYIQVGLEDDYNVVIRDGLQVGEQAALYPEEYFGFNKRIQPVS